jgi:hypothetical protein
MPTLSVFYVGTGHKREETTNILVVLNSLVRATELSPAATQNTVQAQESFKVVFDGPGLIASEETMISSLRTPLLNLLRRLQAKRAHTANDPWVLNLVGHSRGAIACMALAQELHRLGDPAHVNMFLIDPVWMVTKADPQFGLTVENNTHEFFEIFMEDDSNPIFPLALLRLPAGRPTVRVRIPFPGTHGTATQCNSVRDADTELPEIDSFKSIWPIGSVALRTILFQLSRWGTPLTIQGETLIGQIAGEAARPDDFHRILLSEYWRIQWTNRRSGVKRWVNDVKLSRPGEKQKFKEVQGNRNANLLNQRAANPFRETNVFLNEHHFDAFRAVWDAPLPDGPTFATRLRAALLATHDLLNDASAAATAAVRNQLVKIANLDRPGFAILNQSALRFNGQRLRTGIFQ